MRGTERFITVQLSINDYCELQKLIRILVGYECNERTVKMSPGIRHGIAALEAQFRVHETAHKKFRIRGECQ